MATWHQQRAGGIRPNQDLWSVVSDPPNECRSVTLVRSQFEAEQLREGLEFHHPRLVGHVRILPPEGK